MAGDPFGVGTCAGADAAPFPGLALRLNGETMQDESTGDMMFGVARLLACVSAHVELVPGDVGLTRSPAADGTRYGWFLAPGDVMEVSITRLSRQRTPCVAEAPSPGPAEER